MRTKMIAAVALSTLLLGAGAFAQTQDSQNSGAGNPGLPGNKSGPAQTQSGTTSPGPSATPQDTSGIKGLPGNKSGPSERAPKSD